MTVNERIKVVVSFLIREGKGKNQGDIGVRIGYPNSSYLSQVINGRVEITNKFINSLCELDENINKEWIISEKGNMLKTEDELTVDSRLSLEAQLAMAKIKLEMKDEIIQEKERMIQHLLQQYGKPQIGSYPKTDKKQTVNEPKVAQPQTS